MSGNAAAVSSPTRPAAVSVDWSFVAEGFTPAALTAVGEHPGFQAAVDRLAQDRLAVFATTPPDVRWLTRDLARTGVFYAALVRDTVFGGATVNGLWRSAERDRLCSRGRVTAWVERAMAFGLVQAPPGPEVWTQRRLRLDARLHAEALRRLRCDAVALAPLAPELAALATTLDRSEGEAAASALAVYFAVMLQLAVARPDIVAGEARPISALLHTDAGSQLLLYLLGLQPPERSRLLTPVRLAVSPAARVLAVSRAQVHRLLNVAEAAGLLERSPDGGVAPTPTLCADLGWVMAANVQMMRLVARALADRR